MPSRDKVALVTGGSRGIGLGIALQLAKTGFTLAITGRQPLEHAQSALNVVRGHSSDSIYVASDVSSASDRHRLLQTVEERFGRLDVLVNNAGIAPRVRADLLDAEEESFDEIISTNLKGPFFLSQEVAIWMIRQRSDEDSVKRSIINISSVSATVASINRGDYCISKAGIAMATRLWAVRLAEFNIGVYEVRPGIIQTDMTNAVKSKYDNLIEAGLLLEKRWGTPEDVGRAVSVLAGDELPYATGTVLVVDGGLTLARL